MAPFTAILSFIPTESFGTNDLQSCTSSVSTELLKLFAHKLRFVINKNWDEFAYKHLFPLSLGPAIQCNNFGKTKEVIDVEVKLE